MQIERIDPLCLKFRLTLSYAVPLEFALGNGEWRMLYLALIIWHSVNMNYNKDRMGYGHNRATKADPGFASLHSPFSIQLMFMELFSAI